MKTTVLIPLHASRPWRDGLIALITELRDHAALVISDATGVDDTLDHLRRAVGEGPEIRWRGPRPLPPGWRSHANDLLSSVTTPYAMLLSHDDRVGPDWIAAAEAALDEHPNLVGACGSIEPLGDDPLADLHHLAVPSYVTESDAHARLLAALGGLLTRGPTELGTLYRSVLRASTMPLLPPGLHADEWSDVLWALRLLERGPLARIDARYGKTWHAASTHAQWPEWPGDSPSLRRRIIEALESPSVSLVVDVWMRDVEHWRRTLERTHARDLDDAAAALAAQRQAFETSRSWRITAPLRLGRRRHSDTPPK